MESAIAIAFQVAILVFSAVIHEVSHAFTANSLGDTTAKDAGRLTLNPFAHLDPVGSVLMPILQVVTIGHVAFAWAKPVPFDPYRLRTKSLEVGSAIVGIAGPLANIAIAVVFSLFIRMLPVAPAAALPLAGVFSIIVLVNLLLAIFNLLPIPPLDGSKVLFALLPSAWSSVRISLEQFGFLILIGLLIVFPGFISGIIFPAAASLFSLLTGFALPF